MRSQRLLHKLNRLILNDMLNMLRIIVMMYHIILKVRGTIIVVDCCWRARNLMMMYLGYPTINTGC